MERVAELGQLALPLLIGPGLVDETALGAPCHAGGLRRVEREVLLLRHPDRDVRELVEPRRAAELATAGADAGEDLGLVARAKPADLDPRAELRRELDAERGKVDPGRLGRIEDDDVAAVALAVRTEDVDRQAEAARDPLRGLGRVGLATLVLRELELIRRGRLANHRSERRVDLRERGVGGKDLHPRGVLAELGLHDDPLVERELLDGAGLEEVHPAGGLEPSAHHGPRNALASTYGRRSARISSIARAFAFPKRARRSVLPRSAPP